MILWLLEIYISKVAVMGKGKVTVQTNENIEQTIANVFFVPDLKTNLL